MSFAHWLTVAGNVDERYLVMIKTSRPSSRPFRDRYRQHRGLLPSQASLNMSCMLHFVVVGSCWTQTQESEIGGGTHLPAIRLENQTIDRLIMR